MSKKLSEEYQFKHLSAGQLLRDEKNTGSQLGEKIKTYIDKGNLVPSEIVVELMKNAMSAATDKHQQLFIIDGFPRNQENVDIWEKLVGDSALVIGILFLDCSEETMRNRILKRGKEENRKDDTEEIFNNRTKIYREDTLPVVEQFKKQNKVFEVSAEGGIQETYDLCKKIVVSLNLEDFKEKQ